MPQESEAGIVVPEVDLTGEVCPMTFVQAKVHLDQLQPGELTGFVLKPGDQVRSVVGSLRDEGHRVEAVRLEEGAYHVTVRRGVDEDEER